MTGAAKDPDALVAKLVKTLAQSKSERALLRAAEEAVALGPKAAPVARLLAERATDGTLLVCVAPALAACLPVDEAFERITARLAELPSGMIATADTALAQLETPRILDWIEANAGEPLSPDWGHLAALSGVTWPRIAGWLERGKPLSWVALDAIVLVANPEAHPGPELLRPRPLAIADLPARPVVKAALEKIVATDTSFGNRYKATELLAKWTWLRG